MARFSHTTDVSGGDWIAPRLAGEFGAVGLVCCTGFEAYARVFHPVGEDRTRWADVCAAMGRTPHPLMQWGHISGTLHGARFFGDWQGGEPAEGNLDVVGFAVLAEALGGDVIGGDSPITIGVWNGYGHLYDGGTSSMYLSFEPDGSAPEIAESAAQPTAQPTAHEGYHPTFDVNVPQSPTLALPGREYLLFRGQLSTLLDPDWPRASGWAWRWGDTLNLAWPDDHSWFVASEIDFDFTLVGGSRELIDRVLASGLESAEVTETSDLSWQGDLINPL